MKPKPSKAKTAARVEEIVQIVLDGAEPHDLRQYVSEREQQPDTPWTLAEGETGLSDRQIRRYALAAEKVVAESCRTGRKKIMRRHLARRRNLYAKAVAQGDMRTALAVLADEARLLRLYEDPPARKPTGDLPTKPADVVRLLAERLAAVDQAAMPGRDKARLVATVADALLRALGVADFEQQLADLTTRLEQAEAARKRDKR